MVYQNGLRQRGRQARNQEQAQENRHIQYNRNSILWNVALAMVGFSLLGAILYLLSRRSSASASSVALTKPGNAADTSQPTFFTNKGDQGRTSSHRHRVKPLKKTGTPKLTIEPILDAQSTSHAEVPFSQYAQDVIKVSITLYKDRGNIPEQKIEGQSVDKIAIDYTVSVEIGFLYSLLHYKQFGFADEESYLDAVNKFKQQITDNLKACINEKVLFNITRQQGGLVIVLRPTHGVASSNGRIVYMDLAVGMTDARLRQELRSQLQLAALCSRPGLNPQADCLQLPQTKKLQKALSNGYKKIIQYQRQFENYLLQPDSLRLMTNELAQFLKALVCYEPMLYPVSPNTLAEHVKILQDASIVKMGEGCFLAPAGSVIEGKSFLAQHDLIVNYAVYGERVAYQCAFASSDSNLMQKARAFFLDMKAVFDPNKEAKAYEGRLFSVNSNANQQDTLVVRLPNELKDFFFGSYCEIHEKAYGDYEDENYCKRQEVSCSSLSEIPPVRAAAF